MFCPNHWNGVNGFGHEAADRHGDGRVLRVLSPDLDTVAGQLGDAERVLVGLGRQAGEEVELHPPPALRVRRVDRAVQVLLADELVDDLAHAPRARLGREREAGAAGLLDLAGDADGEGVDPQARQRHVGRLTVDRFGDDVAHERLDAELKSAVDSDVSATSS